MDTTFAPEVAQQREILDRAMSGLNTSIPGTIISFNGKSLVTVKPSILRVNEIDGVKTYQEYPPIENVPIIIPYVPVAGFAMTLPIRPGDPCLIVFSQRAIDNWNDKGGIQTPELSGSGVRHHSLTDGIAIIGLHPTVNALSDWFADGLELRNRDRTTRLSLKDGEITIVSGTNTITIDQTGTITTVSDTSTTITAPTTNVVSSSAINLGSADRTSLKSLIDERFLALFKLHTHDNSGGIGVSGTVTQTYTIDTCGTSTTKAK